MAITQRKSSGKLVETKTGKLGYTRNVDSLINGKQPVYMSKEGQTPMLCDPLTLKFLEYYV